MTLNQKNVDDLSQERSAPCISIYLRLAKTFIERKDDRVRLENFIKAANDKLVAAGTGDDYIRRLLKPLARLAQDHFFWKTKAAAMSFFIAPPQILSYFELPEDVEESMRVGDGFNLKPLSKMLKNKFDFYLIAASKNNLALYHSKDDRFEKLDVSGMPKNIKELQPDKTFEKKLQMHGSSPHGKGEIIHGQGVGKETEKVMVLKYFQIADNSLRAVLASRNKPLIFAGAENLFPLFRKANSYPHLFKTALKGNFDQAQPADLLKKAQHLLKSTA